MMGEVLVLIWVVLVGVSWVGYALQGWRRRMEPMHAWLNVLLAPLWIGVWLWAVAWVFKFLVSSV